MNENWLPIPGFEGLYEVSDVGRVRSVNRLVKHRCDGLKRLRGKMIAQRPGLKASGHLKVILYRDGKGHPLWVHRLVLEAFVGPCPDGLMALHADDDPKNNTLSNLSWGTRSQNLLDAVRNGRHWQVNKTHCKQGHPLSGNNLRIRSKSGNRDCKECGRIRSRKHAQRKRASIDTIVTLYTRAVS